MFRWLAKKRILEQVVQEDSEFSDDGDQSDFWGFVAQTQLLVEAAQDWV